MREQNNSENSMLRDEISASSHLPDMSRIRAYYDETWMDYRLLWLNRRNWAIHFGYWDETTHSHSESLINMNRVLARSIGIRPGQRILDAGCGVGGSSIWLAKTYDVEVVGITPVAGQIVRAQRLAQEQNVANRVTFHQEDYTRTTFPEASFDVVWAMESVCHAPDKRLFLAEARRLLRPGGRLGIAEYIRTSRPFSAVDENLLQDWLSGWAIPDLATAREVLQWLQESNFDNVRLENITTNVGPSLRRLYWLTALSRPFTFSFHAIGLRSKTQQGNARGAINQYRALKRALWFYALLTATASVG